MADFHVLAILGIVAMTTVQSWMLMRVVKRLTELESALSAMLKRILTEDADPTDAMSAIGLRGRTSSDRDRLPDPDGIRRR